MCELLELNLIVSKEEYDVLRNAIAYFRAHPWSTQHKIYSKAHKDLERTIKSAIPINLGEKNGNTNT